MTTILDNIQAPDVISPVKQVSLDVENESSGKTKFADIIEQANIKNETDSSEKNPGKSVGNEEVVAVNTESKESAEVLAVTIENEVESATIVSLLPEPQSKTTLKAVKGYTSKEAENIKHTPGLKLQTQQTLDTVISTGSGNKLPGEGQIQPVPPSLPTESLSLIDSRPIVVDGFEFKNQQVKTEIESNLESTKIVNLNPVKAAQNEVAINTISTEIQTETQKGPKQTIQPVDVNNGKLQSFGESPTTTATDVLKSLQKIPQTTSETQIQEFVKSEYVAVNKQPVEVNKQPIEFQKVNEGEVKLKGNNLLSQLVKTDAVVDNSTSIQTQIQQTSAVNAFSVTASQSTEASPIAKLTTMTMQTSYSPGNKEWSENFARNIALMTVSKNNLAEIRMDPPELGAIQVKITHSGNETNLQFQVNHNDTRQAIEASIQKLKDSLAEQGFTNVNVDIQQGEQSQKNDSQQNHFLARTEAGTEDNLLQEQTSILQLQQLPSSGVDFFA